MRSPSALVLAQLKVEVRNTIRNGEQLLLLVAIPLAIYLVWQRNDQQLAFQYALMTGLIAANFTSLSISTAFERRWGVLKSYATSPLTLTSVVSAKALSALCVSMTQMTVLSLMATNFDLRNLVAVLAATASLAPWALLLATTQKAERVLALANLIFLILAGSAWVQSPLIELLPTGALRAVLSGNMLQGVILATLWGFAGAVLTARRGRWTE